MKLAEALLLRKQLQQKVDQLRPVKQFGDSGMLEQRVERRAVNDQVDEMKIQIPRVTMAEVTAEYDHYATELRKLDASIQEANWKFEVNYTESVRKAKKKSEELK